MTLSNTGGTDHQSFDGVGLPGFQFIQDPLDYNTRTHHSNQDVYDRVQPEDARQAAVVVAAFVSPACWTSGCRANLCNPNGVLAPAHGGPN